MITQGTLALQAARSSTGNMVAFYGASASWYGLADRLDEVFVPPLDVDVPAALAASCDPGDAIDEFTDVAQVFQPALLTAAQASTLDELDPWGCMLRENGLTSTSITRISADPPSYGVLFVTGENDDLVDTPTERAAFAALCSAGLPTTYLECAGASHTEATAWALPEILAFLEARLAGEAFTPDCSVGAPSRCTGTPEDE
jgi:hypothetical protein